MTPFGKEIRKRRIDADITLSDMAKALDVPPSYLSAVELGDKPLSEALAKRIIDYLQSLPYFREHQLDVDYLIRVADRTRKTVAVDMKVLEDNQKEVVAAFARKLPTLTIQQRASITQKLEEWMKDTEDK